MRTGLRRRLERTLRTVQQQHGQLRHVDGELHKALTAGAWSEAQEWLERMRDAFRAHFDLEEEVVFPAVHGLLPGTEKELSDLTRDHQRFLDLLHAALGAQPHAQLARDVETLRERVDEHERHEERLLSLALALEESAPPDGQEP